MEAPSKKLIPNHDSLFIDSAAVAAAFSEHGTDSSLSRERCIISSSLRTVFPFISPLAFKLNLKSYARRTRGFPARENYLIYKFVGVSRID